MNNVVLSQTQIQVILNNIAEAIILIDPDGIISMTNQRVMSLLNISPTRLQNQHIDELDPKAQERLGFDDDGVYMLSQQLLAGVIGTDTTTQYELLTPYRRLIRRSQIPIFAEDDRLSGVLLIFADETEVQDMRRTEEEIASMIVHDLKSPLTAVTASMRLLRDIADPEDPLGKIVIQTTDISGRAIRKMMNLVNSLLDAFRMQGGVDGLEREPADIREIVESVVYEFSTLASEMDINLRYSVQKGLPLLDIDAEKIERVLYNLVDNAIKFTPGDGQVLIEVDTADQKFRRHGFVRVRVRDTGSGIPEEERERIFNRFEQMKGTRRGTGLGLTFCKLAVEAHGGQIWIDDNPDGGSIFTFTLPIADIPRLPE